MGDIAPDSPVEGIFDSEHDHREIRALVTGYGPFHSRYPINASWSIASTLPDHLPATPTCPRIKLIVPPKPIVVAYNAVTAWEDQWMDSDAYDIILHIGLAAGRKFFTLERQSTRGPYWQKADVLGQIFDQAATEKLWPSSKFPDILKPTFDCEDVWLRWRDNVRDELDVRPSDDPGNYLCGFIYYSTMAWYWAQNGKGKERPVLFLHVPDLPTEAQVAGGREVAVGLIRAMAESREERGIVEPMDGNTSNVVLTTAIYEEANGTKNRTNESDVATATEGDDMAWTYQR